MRTIKLLLHLLVGMLQYFLHQIAQGIRFVNYMFHSDRHEIPIAKLFLFFNLMSIGEIVFREFMLINLWREGRLLLGELLLVIIYCLTVYTANYFIVYRKGKHVESFEEFRRRYTPTKHWVFLGIYIVCSVALIALVVHLVNIGYIGNNECFT